jgi:hypothetical protein
MKRFAIVGIGVLVLLLGAAGSAYAQDEKQQQEEKAKPAGQEEHQKQDREKTDKAAKQDKAKQDKAAKQSAKQDKAAAQQSAKQAKSVQKDEHAQQAQRGTGRIPDDRFRANFGREHVFVINRPVIVEGAPRFQYGGYWFGFGNPWPVGWAYTDQVYVVFIDGGYYLVNVAHPGVHFALNVIL